MEVQTEEIEYCKVKVTYEADPEVVESKFDDAIAEVRDKHLKGKQMIAGFRKGKAPDFAIKSRCKKQIENYVSAEMRSQAYDDMVYETHMKPIGLPEFSDVKLKGNKFTCNMTVLKKPDFELQQYKDFEIPQPHSEIDPIAEAEQGLRNLQIRFGDVEPYDEGDFVDKGDQITMDFEATIDGEPFEGSKAEGQLYLVGTDIFAGFDDNLLGMMPGDERTFDIVIPEGFPEVGGKTAQCKVTLHMGTKRKPHPLDDELAKKAGAESVDKLRGQLQTISEQRKRQEENNELRQQVSRRLTETHDFQVPEFLKKVEYFTQIAQRRLDESQMSDEDKEAVKTQAENNVRLSLILDTIREEEPDSVMSDAEAEGAIKQRAMLQNQNPEQVYVEAQKSGALVGMVAALRDEFTLQWLVTKCKIIE